MSFLDDIPVATLTFIAGVVLTIIAYVNHDLIAFEAFAAIGFSGGGAGAIGHARNGAGRGVRKP